MKKTCGILIACALLVSIGLAGCGEKDPEAERKAEAKAKAEEMKKKAGGAMDDAKEKLGGLLKKDE